MSATGHRSLWLRTLHQWHWISAALCLVGMLLFAATGVTLNHAAQIEASPRVQRQQAQLPEALHDALRTVQGGQVAGEGPLPARLRHWLRSELGVAVGARSAEWADGEIYLALPRPGGDAWLAIDLVDGAVEYERTDRGVISYLNDLHKGRHTGAAWRWFIDVFAIACLVFCISGLFLLHMHARQRLATWPLVGLGLVVPLLLALLFIH